MRQCSESRRLRALVATGRCLQSLTRVEQGVDSSDESTSNELAGKLSRALGGVTILQKGASDRITNGQELLVNDELGSARRCGGQGDVLSGIVGAYLAWGKNYEEK